MEFSLKQYINKNNQLVSFLQDTDQAINALNSSSFNKADFLFALHNVVIAKGGFARLSALSGLGQESLYKSLSPHSNPRFETILNILQALNLHLQISSQQLKIKKRTSAIRQHSIAHTHKDLTQEWHNVKNNKLTPNDIMAGSKKKVWWTCSNNHEWIASVTARTTGLTCPNCCIDNK